MERNKFRIEVTEDYERLVPFFIENGLEFSEEDPVPTDLVKCWHILAEKGTENEHLAGGFVLAKREGEFIVDGIAVAQPYRRYRLGKDLLAAGIAETERLGGKKIFLVARAPGFFRKHGFVTVAREDAPNFFECLTCPQYGVDCRPEVMRLDLR